MQSQIRCCDDMCRSSFVKRIPIPSFEFQVSRFKFEKDSLTQLET
jgi:hypothetical protein